MSYEIRILFDLPSIVIDDPDKVPFETMSTKPESGLCKSFDSGDAVQLALDFIIVPLFNESLIAEAVE